MFKKIVNKQFQEYIYSEFPALKGNKAYARLFSKLFFYRYDNDIYDDVEDRVILVSHKYLMYLNKTENNTFNADTFLKGFQNDVLPELTYVQDWNYQQGKAREVINTGIPESLYEVYEREYAHLTKEHYFESGTKADPKTIAKDYQEVESKVNKDLSKLLKSDIQKHIFNYHNNDLTVEIFRRKFNSNFDAAQNALETITNKDSYNQTKRILDDVRNYPKPILKPTPKADRLFSLHPSILNIKSEVRKELTKGWLDCDLKSAQLSIVASLWGCENLNQFLSEGKSIWTYLLNVLDLPTEWKPILKKIMYTICFGGRETSIQDSIQKECIKENLNPELLNVVALCNDQFIQELMTKQNERMQAIKSGEIVINPLTNKPIYKLAPHKKLALQCQAYEMILIYEVYKYAETTNDVKITLYQFDGLSISFNKNTGTHQKRISDAVNKKAKELGFNTYLEWN